MVHIKIMLSRGANGLFHSELTTKTPNLPILVRTGNGDLYEHTMRSFKGAPIYQIIPEVPFGERVDVAAL